MTLPSLHFIAVLGFILAGAQEQHCDTCDVTDEPVSFLQKLLAVDASRSKQASPHQATTIHHKTAASYHRASSHKGAADHRKAALTEIPTTMYAVVVEELNPSHCSLRVNDVGPAAQSAIASGCHSTCDADDSSCISECTNDDLDCIPHFERAHLTTFPVAEVVEGKAIVQVAYSSVNPCDYKGVMGMRTDVPYVPGIDLSGIIVQPGKNCDFKVGDRVWGHSSGAWAEYDKASCASLGLMPTNLDWEQAAAMPLVVGTALAVFEWTNAPWSDKPTVLVLGGTGGVGMSGIQLAKYYGAGKIITTCSERNFDLVKSLGADEVLDYHTQNWWEVLKPGSVDIILDTVSLWNTGNYAYDILADGGYFATLIQSSGADFDVMVKRPSIHSKAGDFNALPGLVTEKLDFLKSIVEAGKLRMPIYKRFQLDQAAAALNESYNGHIDGKVTVHVGDSELFAAPIKSSAVQGAASGVLLLVMLAALLPQLA